MTASLPFVRALAVPDRVLPARMGKTPLLANPHCPTKPAKVLVAARCAPALSQPVSLPDLVAPRTGGGANAAPAVRVSRVGVLLSSALHVLLLGGWAVLAAPARPLAPPDLEHARVELMSEAQFAAMTAPQPAAVPDVAEVSAPQAVLDTASFVSPAAISAPPLPASLPMPDLGTPDLSAQARDAIPVPPETAPEVPQKANPEKAVAKAKPAAKAVPSKPKANAVEKPSAKPAKTQKTAEDAADASAKPAKTKPQKAKAKGAAQAVSKGEAKALKADWGGKVRSRINRKVGAAKASGTVKVRLSLAPNGTLLAVGIAQSSGVAALDAAALKAVKAAAPFPRAPKGLVEASYSFTLPITFKG